MFNVLSGQRKRRVISPATIAASIAAHVLLLGGAVYAAASDTAPREVVGDDIILPPLATEPVEAKVQEAKVQEPAPPPPPAPQPPDQPAVPEVPGEVLQLNTPAEVPETITPEPLGTPAVDPRDFARDGRIGNVIGKPPAVPTPAPPTPPTPAPAPDFIPDESMVEERPTLNRDGLASALERYYPSILRQSRTGGRVMIEVVVDTDGRVREGTARVIETTHPAFGDAALRAVQRFRFRPAKIGGVAVPVRVTIPINWTVPN
jgi:periplasmic protein TonB